MVYTFWHNNTLVPYILTLWVFVLSQLLNTSLPQFLLTETIKTMVTNSALNCWLAHYGTEPVINMTHYMFVTSCFHHNLCWVEWIAFTGCAHLKRVFIAARIKWVLPHTKHCHIIKVVTGQNLLLFLFLFVSFKIFSNTVLHFAKYNLPILS